MQINAISSARFNNVPDLGCQNGATCVNLPGGYTCSCAQGFYGVHCRERSNTCASGSNAELCGHGTWIIELQRNLREDYAKFYYDREGPYS